MKRPVTAPVKILLALSVLAGSVCAIDTKTLHFTGYVNDFAGVLDAAGKQQLETYCTNVEQATGAQMAIVTVPSIEDEPVEDVANRLYREWGIGKKGKNEGLLILLAIKERKYRVEVGYGLESYITDGGSGTVMRGVLPIFRQGNYAGGLLAAAQQFGSTIAQAKGVALDQGEPLPSLARQRDSFPIPLPLIIFGVIFILMLLSRGNRGGGIGPRGGGGFLPGLILGNMMGGRGGWGGGGFGGGGGGGGFGGFGGGDSGGGGSSGGW